MAGQAAAATPSSVAVDEVRGVENAQSAPLELRRVDAAAPDAAPPPAYRQVLRSLGSATTVYAAAGLTYAVVLASAWLVFTREDGVPLTRLLWLLSCYAWPTALAVGLIAAVSRGQRALVALAYFAMLFAVALYGVARNAELTFGQLASFWLFTNAPATILLLAFLHRRVRAVGPLVVTFMVTAVVGSQVLLSVVGSGDAGLRGAVSVGAMFGLGGSGVFFALMLLGFALFGVLGWQLLKWLGRRYQQRRMSDQSLTLDAMWLLFGVVQSITLAFEGWLWVFTGPVAFGAYKAVVATGLTITGVGRPAATTHTLLLLRVFALGSKSERLFDALSKRWLRAGSIFMIAGPDLVASTVQPHEFLEFMGGQVSRRFVRGSDDLEHRLKAVERTPDPDGRYRVNEFFCYADTWKETMIELAARTEVVLMDLRSFSNANKGCVFELQQLLDSVPLSRTIFLIDDTTDAVFLEQVMNDAWQRTSIDSPNRQMPAAQARLLRVDACKGAEVRVLLNMLFAPASLAHQAA